MSMMWIKRVLPFVLALALGLFIASFFVTLTMPKFRKFERREHRYNKCKFEHEKQIRELQAEVDYLRRDRTRQTREELRYDNLINAVPPIPIAPAERTVPRQTR